MVRLTIAPLATVALQSVLREKPDHPTDLIGRGEALQHVIDVNLKKLKAADEHYYLCLYCYTYERDPYNGTRIDQVLFGGELRYPDTNIP